MVVIRLARGGDKKNPFYRIVVTDKRNSRDGRFIEQIGYYDPMARGQATPIQLDLTRIDHWQVLGAQMSERVKYLVKAVKKGDVLKAKERAGVQKLAQAAEATKKHQTQLKAQQKEEATKAEAAKAEEAEVAKAEAAKAEAAKAEAAKAEDTKE